MLRIFGLLVVLCLAVSCVDRYGVIGAIFRLRDDSPLPCWVVLPPGTTRDEVRVTITRYEATTTPQWKVRFVVRNKRTWWMIQEAIGYGYWHPDSVEKVTENIYPN